MGSCCTRDLISDSFDRSSEQDTSTSTTSTVIVFVQRDQPDAASGHISDHKVHPTGSTSVLQRRRQQHAINPKTFRSIPIDDIPSPFTTDAPSSPTHPPLRGRSPQSMFSSPTTSSRRGSSPGSPRRVTLIGVTPEEEQRTRNPFTPLDASRNASRGQSMSAFSGLNEAPMEEDFPTKQQDDVARMFLTSDFSMVSVTTCESVTTVQSGFYTIPSFYRGRVKVQVD